MKKKKNKIVKIGIVGIGGKMGKAIAKLALKDTSISIKGGSEQPNHKVLKKDIGDLLGASKLNVHVTDNIIKFFNYLDVVIEFGLEEATTRFVKRLAREMLPSFQEVQVFQIKL